MRIGKAGATTKLMHDGNAAAYDVVTDVRGNDGYLWVLMDRVEPSDFQVRLVFEGHDIEELAASILSNGLIHEPRGRPHPTKPGWIQLLAGERRTRALRRIAETDRENAPKVLRQDGAGNWLMPIRVEPMDDRQAEALVFAENQDRTDLRPWEWACAWQRRRLNAQGADPAITVRGLADRYDHRKSIVGDFLFVADRLSLKVLMGAGVVDNGEADHRRLCVLTMEALKRVAKACAKEGEESASKLLVRELARAGDEPALQRIEAQRAAQKKSKTPRDNHFQVNIRAPLGQLEGKQAAGFLNRIAPVVEVLAERAAGSVDKAEKDRVVKALEAAIRRLK
jgi:ParB-like chromosome segregation protein Spo0J